LGAVSSGFLHVRGRLAAIHLDETKHQEDQNTPFFPFDREVFRGPHKLVHHKKGIELMPDLQSRNRIKVLEMLFLLPIMRYYKDIFGLVLRRADQENGSRRFARWGMFKIWGAEGGIDIIEKYCRLFDTKLSSYSELNVVEDGQGGLKYDITIT
jgi:hypothetical protein